MKKWQTTRKDTYHAVKRVFFRCLSAAGSFQHHGNDVVLHWKKLIFAKEDLKLEVKLLLNVSLSGIIVLTFSTIASKLAFDSDFREIQLY